MSPNPTALTCLVEHEDVEKHRSLSCSAYDDCLDTAVSRRAWRSWTCRNCQLFLFTRLMRLAETSHVAALRPLAEG
jgi:ribosomal protein L37AE/L43A